MGIQQGICVAGLTILHISFSEVNEVCVTAMSMVASRKVHTEPSPSVFSVRLSMHWNRNCHMLALCRGVVTMAQDTENQKITKEKTQDIIRGVHGDSHSQMPSLKNLGLQQAEGESRICLEIAY